MIRGNTTVSVRYKSLFLECPHPKPRVLYSDLLELSHLVVTLDWILPS